VGNSWRRLPWVTGTVLTLLLVVPWYALTEYRTPGFLHYFIIGEHIQRFLVPHWPGDLYGALPVYVGQQMDAYIEAPPAGNDVAGAQK
jgi:4-amino-4-deoxy-L-arabinose transferase-like glycosyltransferase